MVKQASDMGDLLDRAYNMLDGSEAAMEYSQRHGVKSAAILTVTDDAKAAAVAAFLAPHIEGRTVVEIGAGIGLLALHLGDYAKRVYAIEAEPIWATSFVMALYHAKPKHVSYLFGAADEFAGQIKADVAVFCTHSGRAAMREAAALFAPKVLDVYEEILGAKRIEEVEGKAFADAMNAMRPR